MEKVCPWCGQPSDQRRLKNRTEAHSHSVTLLSLVQFCSSSCALGVKSAVHDCLVMCTVFRLRSKGRRCAVSQLAASSVPLPMSSAISTHSATQNTASLVQLRSSYYLPPHMTVSQAQQV